jgi:hypothetical protein
MGRVNQTQNIDELIQSINVICENRCSLSDEDVKLLDEALKKLHDLKRKKGKTNQQVLSVVVQVVVLISKFFEDDCDNDDEAE